MNNNEPSKAALDTISIMKELSDIKSSLSVNTNETANIKSSVNEIKVTVNGMKNDYLTRREFDNQTKTLKEEASSLAEKLKIEQTFLVERVDKLYSIVYWFIGLLGVATFASLSQYIFK